MFLLHSAHCNTAFSAEDANSSHRASQNLSRAWFGRKLCRASSEGIGMRFYENFDYDPDDDVDVDVFILINNLQNLMSNLEPQFLAFGRPSCNAPIVYLEMSQLCSSGWLKPQPKFMFSMPVGSRTLSMLWLKSSPKVMLLIPKSLVHVVGFFNYCVGE